MNADALKKACDQRGQKKKKEYIYINIYMNK